MIRQFTIHQVRVRTRGQPAQVLISQLSPATRFREPWQASPGRPAIQQGREAQGAGHC